MVKRLFNSKLAFVAIGTVVLSIVLFCWLQFFWTKRYSANLDENVSVKLKYQDLMMYFLDPNTTKTLMLVNRESGANATYEYWSEDWNTYFFIINIIGRKAVIVKDDFRGANELDYNTLRPLREDGNRFEDLFSIYQQASDSLELGKPTLALIDGLFVK